MGSAYQLSTFPERILRIELAYQKNCEESMQKEDVRIRLYTIEDCGFYRRGSQDPQYGLIDEIIEDLKDWVSNRNINQTCTYNPEGNFLKTYCCDIRSNSCGDFLITIWNETASNDGTIAFIDGDKPVGKADLSIAEVDGGNIPGYPTYFWFMPSIDKFATIQLSGSTRNGVRNLGEYLRNYMKWHSSYANREHSKQGHLFFEEEISVLNYRITSYSDKTSSYPIPENMIVKFNFFLHEKGGKSEDFIRQNRNSIQRALFKSTLTLSSSEEKGFVERFFDVFSINKERMNHELNFSYNMEFNNPSEEEVEALIKAWRRLEAESESEWEDLGFEVLEECSIRKTKKVWMSKYIASSVFRLPVKKDSEKVDIENLLNVLTEQKKIILNKLNGGAEITVRHESAAS